MDLKASGGHRDLACSAVGQAHLLFWIWIGEKVNKEMRIEWFVCLVCFNSSVFIESEEKLFKNLSVKKLGAQTKNYVKLQGS